jgi:hypothetical protein
MASKFQDWLLKVFFDFSISFGKIDTFFGLLNSVISCWMNHALFGKKIATDAVENFRT